MLVRCLYASRPVGALTERTVDSIVSASKRNNPALGITGVLCANDEAYIQVLEGGRSAVAGLFSKISADERHSDVTLLLFEEISERHYGHWTMAQLDVAQLNPATVLRYFETSRLDPFSQSGRATQRLLEELVDAGAMVSRKPFRRDETA